MKLSLLTFIIFIPITFLCAQVDQAPSITAEGEQAFCIGKPINIVTEFTITDPDDTGIESFFVQISSGYQVNFDELELTGSHPFIESSWDVTEGKLTLTSSFTGNEIPFINLINAVKDIVFTTSATNVSVEKTFSLSIGNANYLPQTDHFYEFVEAANITWKDAKTAAENRTYFGRQGYLATLTSQLEADFAGKQASGPGWIGGSDEETEGEWKWVTGPEAGTVFWNGAVNGSTPNFAFWNNNEPNNSGDEDYAHITDPSIGNLGAWNDLPNEGGTGLYIPRGYIVEYGIPTDPELNIVATTRIFIPQIISTSDATVCISESATITATASEGEVIWFEDDNPSTSPLPDEGNELTIDNVMSSRTYYASISFGIGGCTTLPRTPVTITVISKPQIVSTSNDLICSGVATLEAQASSGEVYWFDSATSTEVLKVGNEYTTEALTETRSYYVEARNSSCDSSTRVEVIAEINNTIPQFDVVENTVVLCTDIGSVDLETTNPQGNYTYIWRKEGELLNGNSAELNVTSSGNYSVTAISEAGCESSEKNIRVNLSEKATITKDDVIIIDDSDNNSIQIINPNLGIGDYEFAIDNASGIYQREPFFDNLSTGIHTLFIRDIGGCGTSSFVFSILAYPKFFTPNNDNLNDVWNILGFNQTFFPSFDISIFNRYGNLIYKIDENSNGWDGTYLGKKLPSNSYWFKAILTDINGLSIEKTGHFSLIRK